MLDCCVLHTLGGAATTKQILDSPNGGKQLQALMADVLIDLSQNPCRKAFSNHGNAKCLTTSTTLYSFARDRIITGFEKMLLQGHSQGLRVPASMADRELGELAGQGISLPSLGLVVVSLLCSTGLGR